jgi:hypothetical protein
MTRRTGGRGTCARCARTNIWIKNRQLCDSCYMRVKADGTLDQDWPTLAEMNRRGSGLCQCFSPIRQELPLWGAAQCLKCGKKMP